MVSVSRAERKGASTFQHSNMPDRSPTRSLQERALGSSFGLILRMLASTWRVRIQGQDILADFEKPPRKHILAFWHRHYITLFWLFRNRSAIVVTNQSHRGQIITEICQRNRMPALQLRAKRTRRMLDSIEQATSRGCGLGIAVDGPLGPPCEVKRGVLHLASRLNCPIIPLSVSANRRYVFAGRWDRLEIPYPFSRVSFAVGAPFHVPAFCSRDAISTLSSQLNIAIEGRNPVRP